MTQDAYNLRDSQNGQILLKDIDIYLAKAEMMGGHIAIVFVLAYGVILASVMAIS